MWSISKEDLLLLLKIILVIENKYTRIGRGNMVKKSNKKGLVSDSKTYYKNIVFKRVLDLHQNSQLD